MGRILSAAIGLGSAAALAASALSGGSTADPRTPPALSGLPPPFLGSGVVGSGGLTAAIDAYGDVVDLRAPGPAGRGLISNPSDRQAAGSVPADTGIVARVSAGGRAPLPLWRGRQVTQSYLPGTNVLRTVAWPAGARVTLTDAALGPALARQIEVRGGPREPLRLLLRLNLTRSRVCRPAGESTPTRGPGGGFEWRGRGRIEAGIVCDPGTSRAPRSSAKLIAAAARADRGWLARARSLGPGAPGWAERMQRRSLLVLRALTDRRSGAVAAGIRDGWAYVWPRDAAATAIALADAGFRARARRVSGFLASLPLAAAARFRGDGSVVGGRGAQGDEAGWARAAAAASGQSPAGAPRSSWRSMADYGERGADSGDYLGNAIAAGVPAARLRALFSTPAGLVRRAGDPSSGLDSAAAWAVRPFPRPALAPLVRRSLRSILAGAGRFGIQPSQDWPGEDPWTAPTAWSAWALAALADRRGARRLLGDLRRAATPAGLLPERVGAASGIPRSTTPLGWSHAFSALALEQLFPRGQIGG